MVRTHLEENSFFIARWVFLRLLGITFLIAFLSVWWQIHGLVGSSGILSAQEYLGLVFDKLGVKSFLALPTVFWINSGDFVLHFVCFLGVIFSCFLLFSWFEAVSLFVLWALYLSIINIGQVFFSFQWDVLLLEVSFLSIFLSPWCIRAKSLKDDKPFFLVRILLYCVLFRVVFESGVVKLLSQDEVWRDLSGLSYHFFTQPLPNGVSWFVHNIFPYWIHKVLTFCMFVIELIFPFFIFFGRRMRLVAFVGILIFMGSITVTGNYTFFNLLTVSLLTLLVDDYTWKKIIPQFFFGELDFSRRRPKVNLLAIGRNVLACVLAIVVVVISVSQISEIFLRKNVSLKLFTDVRNVVRPFHSINRYGLFAVMTTRRPEIIVEGSYDGVIWKAYEFTYKPGI